MPTTIMHDTVTSDNDHAADTDVGPMPPRDEQAEQAVLGTLMLSSEAIADVVEILVTEDFYRPAHQAVYDAVLTLYARGEPTDPVAVAGELEARNILARVGGAPYLHTLIQVAPAAVSAGWHAQVVADQSTYRQLTEAGMRITQDGYAAARVGSTAEDAVDRAQSALSDVAERNAGSNFSQVGMLTDGVLTELDAIQQNGGAVGLTSGYTDLDNLVHGLKGGQMITIAARPGVGKSTMGMDLARHTAIRAGQPVGFFSLEMGKSELTMRMLSAEARVRHDRMSGGYLSDDEWAALAKATYAVNEAPLFIDDSPGSTPMRIRAKARRLHQQKGLALIVVDYLQLMTSGRRVESRQVEVSEFSRQLKLLAKELDVPVIAISQLNRSAEQRGDGRPAMSDLRESGAIEQDSDVVVLLHRPDLHDPESERAGELDVIVAKQRGGRTGTVTLANQLHYCRFMSFTE